jgi:Ca-activated chloride channel homolog
VVVLSDGEDTSSRINDDQVLDLARRAGIGVYGVALCDAEGPAAPRRQPQPSTFFSSALGQATGAEAHFLKSISQLEGAYDRLAQELRSQYGLGYVSTNASHDGSWRRIVVRTPHRESLGLRHRIGYFAPKR